MNKTTTTSPLEFRDTFHELELPARIVVSLWRRVPPRLLRRRDPLHVHAVDSNASDHALRTARSCPYETIGPDRAATLDIHADVDAKSFDLDYRQDDSARRDACCECGDDCDACGSDPCGCGDACGCPPACPAWDITWSGGLRFADVDWNRTYVAPIHRLTRSPRRDLDASISTAAARALGLEGRRYFGQSNWCSVYLKGDISMLLGQMQLRAIARRPTKTGNVLTSRNPVGQHRQIIPVTEIEAGVIGRIRRQLADSRPATCSAPGTTWASATNSTFADVGRNELRRRQHPGLRRLLRAARSRRTSRRRRNQSAEANGPPQETFASSPKGPASVRGSALFSLGRLDRRLADFATSDRYRSSAWR